MVKIGQTIVPIDFSSSVHPLLPVEVRDRDELFDRYGPQHFVSTQRPSFDCLILMVADGGTHSVDFVEIPVRPGRLIRVRAGQAQAWDPRPRLDATVVLGAPGTSTPLPWFPGDPSFTDLDDDGLATATAVISALRRHQATFDGDPPTIRLMVSLFDALAAVFDRSADTSTATTDSPVYLAFRTAIEHESPLRRDVGHYAGLIGYSERTVTRACLKVTGQTAKQVLINRLVLEAKWLLARTELAVAEISTMVGFSEPTNFTKFFVRHAGSTPSGFRAATGVVGRS